MYIGWAELTAGDPAEAEGPLREGIAVLEAAGEKGWLATTAAVLAEVLWRQGKGEEAERYALLSDRLAVPDDWASQWQWRAAQAKVLADRDQLSEAEALARAAVSVIDQTDWHHVARRCSDEPRVRASQGREGTGSRDRAARGARTL